MKIAYIILAHKNPKQLARLVNRLNTQDTVFSIHIDSAAALQDFKSEVKQANPGSTNIYFQEKRYRTRWGGFIAVKATAELIESVLDHKPDHILFLSGQDYPIKSNDDIRDYLIQYKGKALMEWRPVDFDTDPKIPNRINRYYFCDYFDWDKANLIPRLLTKLLPKRNFIEGIEAYIGRVQFVLPLDIAKFVVSEFKSNKKLKDFFKYVLCADELYFQTLLMNSQYANRVHNVRTHFADYTPPHPVTWESKDIDMLKKQVTLFARKFNASIDEKILELIDDYTSQHYHTQNIS